jgi:hypothetical protein
LLLLLAFAFGFGHAALAALAATLTALAATLATLAEIALICHKTSPFGWLNIAKALYNPRDMNTVRLLWLGN